MGIFNKKKARARAEPTTNVPTGRVSSGSSGSRSFWRRTRSTDLLKELRNIHDEADAIEFMTKKTPDGSMALWNFVRMANQGHQMKFYPISDKKREISIEEVEAEWRDFASRVNVISNAGLDGLIDIFHKNAVLFGNQMCEVEVNKDRTDIVEVHPIDPRTIEWEWEVRNGKKVPIPYQYNDEGRKVDLSKGNVFYVPLDPGGDDPSGTLIMAPALSAIDSQLQVFEDVHAVLHHQGYTRDMYTIELERALTMCPPGTRNNPKELAKWLAEHQSSIANTLQNIEPDSDIVTYDDVKRAESKGGVARSVDFRAINEMTDYQTNNGLKQLGTFMNRHTGKTETYSSVEYLIMTQGIKSLQRGSKRLIENIAKLWLRVKGIQAVPIFTHNVIDYVSELQRMDINLKNAELHATAQLMGWIDGDMAAREVMGTKKSAGEPSENISVSFSNRGGDVFENNDKHSRETRKLGSEQEENTL